MKYLFGIATGIALVKLWDLYQKNANKVKTTIGDAIGNVNPVQPTTKP